MTKEEKLISGLRRRSHTSLEKAIELYTPYVTVVVYGVIGAVMAREDIEEVVSDVFLSLWRNASGLDGGKGRLKELISETGIPDADLKISTDNSTRRVTASITAAPSERKRYMRHKILKASLIAACAAVICTAAAFAASPAGREAIGNIISYFQNDRVNEITDTEELAKYSAQTVKLH